MRKFLISVAILGLVGGTSLATAQDRDHRGGDDSSHSGGQRGDRSAPQAAPQAAPNPAATNGRNAIGQRETREHHDVPAASSVAQAQQSGGAAAAADAIRGINRSVGNPNPGQDSNRSNSNDGQRGNSGRQDNNRQDNNRQDNNRQDNNRSDFNGQNANRQDFNNDRRDNRRNDNNRPDFNQRNSNGFGNDMRGDRRGGSRQDFSNFRNFHQNFRAERRFRAPSYRRPPGYYARRWSWGQVLPSAFWAQDYWLGNYYDYDLPPPPYGAVWVRVGEDALLIDRYSGEIIEVDYGVFY